MAILDQSHPIFGRNLDNIFLQLSGDMSRGNLGHAKFFYDIRRFIALNDHRRQAALDQTKIFADGAIGKVGGSLVWVDFELFQNIVFVKSPVAFFTVNLFKIIFYRL